MEGEGRVVVAGIDYSTKDCHVVVVDDSGAPVVSASLKFKGKLSTDRLLTVRRTILDDLAFAEILFPVAACDELRAIGIEDPRATNPKLRSMIAKLARVQGAIVQTFREGADVHWLNAKQWRTGVGLAGNASKEAVAAWAVEHGMPEDLAQDYYDAFVIARTTLLEVSGDVVRSNASEPVLD